MRSTFPSEAWCHEAVARLNDDPALPEAARGWQGDFGVVVDAASGPLAVHLPEPAEGRFPPPRVIDPAQLEALSPRYFARASEADWRALLQGGLDPIAAIVQKRLVARGDLGQVVARLQHRGVLERWLAQVRTGG